MIYIGRLEISESGAEGSQIEVTASTEIGFLLTKATLYTAETYKNVVDGIDITSLLSGIPVESFTIKPSDLNQTGVKLKGLYLIEFESNEPVTPTYEAKLTAATANLVSYFDCLVDLTILSNFSGCEEVSEDCEACKDFSGVSSLLDSVGASLKLSRFDVAARTVLELKDICESCSSCPSKESKLVAGTGYKTISNGIVLI